MEYQATSYRYTYGFYKSLKKNRLTIGINLKCPHENEIFAPVYSTHMTTTTWALQSETLAMEVVN